jgi:hypothetical protein
MPALLMRDHWHLAVAVWVLQSEMVWASQMLSQ